jgi:hypothetical protein
MERSATGMPARGWCADQDSGGTMSELHSYEQSTKSAGNETLCEILGIGWGNSPGGEPQRGEPQKNGTF